MQRIKEAVPMFLVLVVMFYYIYPQALDVRGSSFILLSGVIGLGLYAYHGFPFKEVIYVLIGIGVMYFSFLTSNWINMTEDSYTIGYPKSQIAWFFSAYLVIFLIFSAHKKPTFNTLLLYIAAAIGLQAIIAFAMNTNEGINNFFFSLQMQAQYTEAIMEEGGSQRIMGYGIAFFGAGAISGMGLIAISYLLMRLKLKTKEFLLLALLYVFVFYIGLFMARTTIIGMAIGFALIAVLYLWDNRSQKKQAKTFLIASVFLMAGGYIFAIFFFPSFSDWAFELFTNFLKRGELTTRSSSGLDEMFIIPQDAHTLLFGKGRMDFHGTDVGYSRQLFWTGIPGTIIYFGFQYYIARLSSTKDWAINIFPLAVFVYSLALNIKGWIDMNFILYLIFFYFVFYKYYVYMPKQYMRMKTVSNLRKRSNIYNKNKTVL
ncbi:MAG: hypothetical protein ACK5KT_00080 [Dysgonomonas sp.]